MKILLQLASLFGALFLAACNTDSSNSKASELNLVGNKPETNALAIKSNENNFDAILNTDVKGFWNSSFIYSSWVKDVSYTHIAEDGTYTTYNHLKDTFDGGEDCYQVSQFSLSRIDDQRFSLSDGNVVADIEIDFWSEDRANFVLPIGQRVYNKAVNLTEKDLTPLCNNTLSVTYNFTPTLKDMVGLWDQTKLRPGITKQSYSHYMLIDEKGVHTTYWKDSENQCFYQVGSNGLVVDLGEGDFENFTSNGQLYSSYKATLINNDLYINASEFDPGVMQRVTQDKDEVLSPMCGD